MEIKPTGRQIEAYKFVYLLDCKHSQAAELMGCSRSNVTRLLLRLKKHKPDLFPPKQHFTMETYTDTHDSQTIVKY